MVGKKKYAHHEESTIKYLDESEGHLLKHEFDARERISQGIDRQNPG